MGTDLKPTTAPAASTPLTGAELIPCAQGGVSKALTAANIAALAPAGTIGGTTGATNKNALRSNGTGGSTAQGSDLVIGDVAGAVLPLSSAGGNLVQLPASVALGGTTSAFIRFTVFGTAGLLQIWQGDASNYAYVDAFQFRARLAGNSPLAMLTSTGGVELASTTGVLFTSNASDAGQAKDSGIVRSGAAALKGTDGSSGIGSLNGLRPPTSSAGSATTTQLPTAGECCIHKNTTTGFVHLAFNDGGVIKSVQMT